MSRKHTPATRATAPVPAAPVPATFDPAPVTPRQDGWTPERQVAFVEALAEGGCVDGACKRVGMGTSSAYALRRRPGAQGFRAAWDAALDMAVERLSDAVFARAIKGVSTPIFYKGEQVGERVRHDEKLAMFLLRYRDPVRYGAWTDRWRAERAPDGAAIALARATDALRAPPARPAPSGARRGPARTDRVKAPVAADRRYVAVHEQDVADARKAADRTPEFARATEEETNAKILSLLAAGNKRHDPGADGSCGSSTSAPPGRSSYPASSAVVAGSGAPP